VASYRDVTTSRGKPSRESTVEVCYRFYGPGGDFVEAVVPGEAMDFGDKGVAKAMSVAYRIALLQVFAIPTDDPDPDTQVYERAPDPPPTKAPTGHQAARYEDLSARVGAATTEAELLALWEDVKVAYKGDDLVTGHANALKAEIGHRRGTLAAPAKGEPEQAAEADAADDAEQAAGLSPATKRTQGRLFALLTKHDYTEREAYHAFAELHLEREVLSMSSLTEDDARKLIDVLTAKTREAGPS
jgi:hypothetical protein